MADAPTSTRKSALRDGLTSLAFSLAVFGFGIYEYVDLGLLEADPKASRTKGAIVAFVYNNFGRSGVLVFFFTFGAAILAFAAHSFLKFRQKPQP